MTNSRNSIDTLRIIKTAWNYLQVTFFGSVRSEKTKRYSVLIVYKRRFNLLLNQSITLEREFKFNYKRNFSPPRFVTAANLNRERVLMFSRNERNSLMRNYCGPIKITKKSTHVQRNILQNGDRCGGNWMVPCMLVTTVHLSKI